LIKWEETLINLGRDFDKMGRDFDKPGKGL
jgi:hypothetical protein